MACGCGGAAKRREMLRSSHYAPTRDGGYRLASYPDCTTLHLGAYQGNSIYVVGRGTEFERLFRRHDLASATEYALETKQQIENLPTTSLCDEAVLSVYA